MCKRIYMLCVIVQVAIVLCLSCFPEEMSVNQKGINQELFSRLK